jgi:hypothetical protein
MRGLKGRRPTKTVSAIYLETRMDEIEKNLAAKKTKNFKRFQNNFKKLTIFIEIRISIYNIIADISKFGLKSPMYR